MTDESRPLNLSALRRREAAPDERPQHAAAAPIPRPPSRWRTRRLVPAVILLSAAGLLLYGGRRSLQPALDVDVAPVVVRSVQAAAEGAPADHALLRPTGSPVTQAAGWIEADPFPVNVTALADGVVAEVLALEGQRVEAGQVVARLIDDDARLAAERAEADAEEAEAARALAAAELDAAQRAWDNPIERTRDLLVAEGGLAESHAAFARLEAEIVQENAKSDEIADEVNRKSRLVESGAVSPAEFSRLTLRLAAQRAAATAVEAGRPAAEAVVRQRSAERDAARENLRLRIAETLALDSARAGLARADAGLRRARAASDEAALRLNRMEVRAPSNGIVMSRFAEPGGQITSSGPAMQSAVVMRLYDPARLQARVDVALADAAKVGVGQVAEVVTDALPDQVFRARVTRLVHEANIQKNTIQVKVAIDEPSPELRPEMLVRVRFFGAAAGDRPTRGEGPAVREGTTRVFAPTQGIHSAADGHAVVWVVDRARSVASERRVTLAPGVAGGWREVEGGLSPGDRVILGDPSRLREGRRVRVVREMASEALASAEVSSWR